MTQEELQLLSNLLDKAQKTLDLCDLQCIRVWFEDDLQELVLYGEDSREGVRRTVSSKGIEDEYM